jgi:hypothetical protein
MPADIMFRNLRANSLVCCLHVLTSDAAKYKDL